MQRRTFAMPAGDLASLRSALEARFAKAKIKDETRIYVCAKRPCSARNEWHERCLAHLAQLEAAADQGKSLDTCFDAWSKLCVEAGGLLDEHFSSQAARGLAFDLEAVSPLTRAFIALLRGLGLRPLLDRSAR